MIQNPDEIRQELRAMLSSPMRDNLSIIGADTALLLYLDPFANEVRFVSLDSAGGDARVAAQLERMLDIESEVEKINREGLTHAYFFQLIRDLCERTKLSVQDVYKAAVYWMQSQGLTLGDYITLPDNTTRKVSHWSWNGSKRPLIRFQDALDWAATYRFDLKELQRERADTHEYTRIDDDTNSKVLVIPRPGERENIVTRDNFYVYLAEHILSLGPRLTMSSVRHLAVEPSDFTFYFWPLRGLGQWRAGVLWVSHASGMEGAQKLREALQRETSTLAQSMLSELFSLLLLNTFGLLVRQSLSPETAAAASEPPLEQLARAFPLLWWASEILFFKNGTFKYRIGRDQNGTMVANQTPVIPPKLSKSQSSSSLFFEIGSEGHPEMMTIRLRLQNLVLGAERRDDRDTLILWPFDEVYFRLSLFTDGAEQAMRWAEQLEQRLAKIIQDQTLQRQAANEVKNREREQVYDGLGHMLKGSISLTGWYDALESLREEFAGKPMPPAIKKAERSLSLLSVLEGSTGLLRLVGILNRKEYGKLTHWFTRLKSTWDAPGLMNDYSRSLTHIAQAVGSALGYPYLEVKVDSEPPKRYEEMVMFSTRLLNFPPLSKEGGIDPIFAMLPAFIEPLINAIRYLRDTEEVQKKRPKEPVKLVMKDQRSSTVLSHISVVISNYCPTRPPSYQTGVRTTQTLMERTLLAGVCRGDFSNNEWSVLIKLHPQKLHEFLRKKDQNWYTS